MTKKKFNLKGFTLLEILGVIVIISILMTLIVAGITRYSNRGKEEYYNKLRNQIELAAKTYYSNNPEKLPRGQLENNKIIYNTQIPIQSLLDQNYITNEIVDENGENCKIDNNNGYVKVSNISNNYKYDVCFVCNGKAIRGNNCIIGNLDNDTPFCSITTENNKNSVRLRIQTNYKKYLTPLNNVTTEISGETYVTYIVNKPGNYTFKVTNSNRSITTYCSATVYMQDIENPKCSVTETSSSNSSESFRITVHDDRAVKKVEIKGLSGYSKTFNTDNVTSDNTTVWDFNKDSSAKTYTVTVTDATGKEGTCSLTVPKKTSSSGGGGGGTVICIDGGTGRCSGGGSSGGSEQETNPETGCFLKGTKVFTTKGYASIEKIKVGDYVLSYNQKTGEQEYKQVTKLLIHPNNKEQLYELTINGKVLKVTAAHRIYIKEKNSNNWIWKETKNINIGDSVLDSNNNIFEITNIKHYQNYSTVYNIEVEDNHNYYVGEGYLVHNKKYNPNTGQYED